MKKHYMVTSESVTEGHPDKLCDKISDAIVDCYLMQDPYARVRVQCAVSSAIVFIAARSHSAATVDLSYIARKVIRKIGYDQAEFNANTCSILTSTQAHPGENQPAFREADLTDQEIDRIPAKNQVTVFGFACKETPSLMPLPIDLAHRLARRLDNVRRDGTLAYLEPDGKVQVGIEYRDQVPHRLHSVAVMASQKQAGGVKDTRLQEDIRQAVVESTFQEEPIRPDNDTRIFVNPEGPYFGGPTYHSGLAGRKNAIDTYGEYCRNSGKALSGKDPVRIDRVGAYAVRHAAKNLVAAGLASKCEIMASYSIGLTRPVSLEVETFGTGKRPDEELADLVRNQFEFRLAGIIRNFKLRHLPKLNKGKFYQHLAAYGHFGRTDMDLPWEKTDRGGELT
ncbi:MAG: methionine adenosyltransferase [Thermodesulfobacteriota bacterium]